MIKHLLSTLGGLGYAVYNEDFTDFSAVPCITVKELVGNVVARSETQTYIEYTFQVKAWADTVAQTKQMKQEIEKSLSALGGKLEFEMPVSDGKISQEITRYRFLYRELKTAEEEPVYIPTAPTKLKL